MPTPLRALLPTLLLCLAGISVQAADEMPSFAGTTFDGRGYELAQRRGRVVLVMLWRTDCAVCLNKMPELRANAQGWQHKPFDLVTINLDGKREDALAYERARQQTGAARYPVWSLWAGNGHLPTAWQQPQRLPVLLLIGPDGSIARRWDGRVPPEAWDDVAELIP
jgi:thiol-disulfide isomerase/thioredoxin